MFRNLKIGVRLGLSFALILILLGTVTYIGIDGFKLMKASTDDIVNNRTPKMELALELQRNAETLGLVARDQMMAGDARQLEKAVQQMQTVRARNDKVIETLVSTVSSERGKEKLADVMRVRAEYSKAQDRLVELLQSGKKDEAQQWLRTEQREAREAMTAVTDAYFDHEKSSVAEAGKEAEQTYLQASKMMLGGAAIAAFLALIAGVWVTLSITRPIGL
ncbi:MAG TPA: MCP four helix bundle domain-containing protein, partial [Steroidobacter sp.]|nr:MCP four helix bundle domain-containing protein [Steroidobacter sp.]